MYLFLLFFFSILFLMGAAICLISVAKFTTYAETEGEIIDYLKCNPPDDESLQKAPQQEEAVVVSYEVGGKTYHLATNIKKSKKAGSASPLKILYDPYLPSQSQLKEGTPLLGGILVIASIIGLATLIFFF